MSTLKCLWLRKLTGSKTHFALKSLQDFGARLKCFILYLKPAWGGLFYPKVGYSCTLT